MHFCPRGESVGKKGKNVKYSHSHWGQVPLEWTRSGPRVRGAREISFKNFGLYINVLRIRFGVETTLADKLFGWTGRTY